MRSTPPREFWMLLGSAAVMLALLGGIALVAWASGGGR